MFERDVRFAVLVLSGETVLCRFVLVQEILVRKSCGVWCVCGVCVKVKSNHVARLE